MTWNPLKKNYLLDLRPISAFPCLEVAEDRALDIIVQRLVSVENSIRRMIKEMKKYIDTIRNLDRADQRITINLSNCPLVHNNDDFRKIVEEYHSVTTQSGQTIEETIALLQKVFIEPLKKLREEFSYIKESLTKRDELVNLWKAAHNNTKKYQEKHKTGTYIVKLEKERKLEESLSKELKLFHSQLVKDLSIFLDKRLDYLKPTFQAFISIQLEYFANSTKMFTQLMPSNNTESPTTSLISEEEHFQELNIHINNIKSLTIIKND